MKFSEFFNKVVFKTEALGPNTVKVTGMVKASAYSICNNHYASVVKRRLAQELFCSLVADPVVAHELRTRVVALMTTHQYPCEVNVQFKLLLDALDSEFSCSANQGDVYVISRVNFALPTTVVTCSKCGAKLHYRELKERNGDFLIKKDFMTIVVGKPTCTCCEGELY